MLEITANIVKWQILWLMVFFAAIYLFNLKVLLPFLQHGIKDRNRVINVLRSEAAHIEEEAAALEEQLATLSQNIAIEAKNIVQHATREANLFVANKAAELNKKMADSLEFSLRNAQDLQSKLESSLQSVVDSATDQVLELILSQTGGTKSAENAEGS